MLIIWATMIAVTVAAPDRSGENPITANMSDSDGTNSNSICETPVCLEEASAILRKIDRWVNPCKNFYKFACGKFLDETAIPNNRLTVHAISLMRRKINDQIVISLSDGIKENDLPVFQYMKSFYQMCLNTEKIAKNTGIELKEVLTKLGGWPILHGSSWNGTDFDWQKFVIESGQMGFDTCFFLNVDVEYDLQNSTKYLIQIDYPTMKMFSIVYPSIEIYGDAHNPYLDAYARYMKKIASILEVNLGYAEEDVINVRNFERKLLEISSSGSNEYRTTVGELEQKYPKISWIEYINGVIASNIQISRNEEVLIKSPDFLDKFYALIDVTPNRVLANYGMWSIIQQSFEYTEGPLHDAFTLFADLLLGQRTQKPRRDVCLSFIKEYLSTALGSLYVRLYFDKMNKIKVTSLIGNIRASLHHMIEQANWMDNNTKGQALDKLDSMSQYVGYPDELINDEKLNDYYKNLKVHPESFLNTYLSLAKFNREKTSSYIMTAGNKSRWIAHNSVHRANALYVRAENTMNVPAAILQAEFFNATRPKYMNYGAIGWIIGHEMTHAFDNEGSKYDKNGDLVDWWQPQTRRKYFEKVDCFIEQYRNYTVGEVDMAVDGQRTVNENIADNVGVKAAYHAYNEWAQKNDREPQLPGLDYTPQQMFWISAANFFCKKSEKKYLKSSMRVDVHSPSEFRVIGSMSNLPEFSKDFQCPPQSPMNPDNKCMFW